MDPSFGSIVASLASKASQPSGATDELAAIGLATVARLREVPLGEHRPDDFDELLSRVEAGDDEAVARLAEVVDDADQSELYPALLPLAAEAGHAGFIPPPPADVDTSDSILELEREIAQQQERFAAEPENRGFGLELALRLDELTIRNRDLGRNEAALEAAQQGRAFAAVLAEIDPGYQLDISFDLLSDAYARLGRFEEAATVKEESIERRSDPWALKELSGYYTALGRFDDAVEKAEEAVAIERESAHAKSHQSLLALLLEHLSTTYRAAGRKEDALIAIEQPIAINRTIAGHGPVTGCELGRTLTERITLLDELGELRDPAAACQEAIAATENCLALHRVMASTDIDGLANLLAQRATLARISGETKA